MKKDMRRLEFIAVILSLQALLKEGKTDTALELIEKLIKEASKESK